MPATSSAKAPLLDGYLKPTHHSLEAGMQLHQERWFGAQSQDPFLHHSALHVIILDDDVFLQDFDGVELVCSPTLR